MAEWCHKFFATRIHTPLKVHTNISVKIQLTCKNLLEVMNSTFASGKEKRYVSFEESTKTKFMFCEKALYETQKLGRSINQSLFCGCFFVLCWNRCKWLNPILKRPCSSNRMNINNSQKYHGCRKNLIQMWDRTQIAFKGIFLTSHGYLTSHPTHSLQSIN